MAVAERPSLAETPPTTPYVHPITVKASMTPPYTLQRAIAIFERYQQERDTPLSRRPDMVKSQP